MTEVPKIVPGIVYDRLQVALPQPVSGQTHPDANMLTAFAEQSIPASERSTVLAHLARCAECRDVLVLALPSIEVGNVSTAPKVVPEEVVPENDVVGAQNRTAGSLRNWISSFTLASPTLQWAAMAAGVAVVASVLLVRPGKLNQSQGNLDSANRPVAVATQRASGAQTTPSSAPAPHSEQLEDLAKVETPSSPKLRAELQTSKKLDSPSEVLMAENTVASEAKDLDRARAVSDTAASRSAASTTNGTMNGASMARNETRNETLSIEKAKPASPANEAEVAASKQQKEEPSSSNSPAKMDTLDILSSAKAKSASSRDVSRADVSQTHPATFAVSGGILQRSLDTGQNWEKVLHADHSLLCYASKGRDVWTGGEAGVLFHSADDGVTWIRVQASVGPQMLTSDITNIDLSRSDVSTGTGVDSGRPATVVISTLNQEVWSSPDGGTTWARITLDKK